MLFQSYGASNILAALHFPEKFRGIYNHFTWTTAQYGGMRAGVDSIITRWRDAMKKTYVLDTNVLIQAPYAISCFQEHTVVIPLVVIE